MGLNVISGLLAITNITMSHLVGRAYLPRSVIVGNTRECVTSRSTATNSTVV